MKTIRTYNNTEKTYGLYNIENNSVDAVFETEAEAREELDFYGDGYEVVRVEPNRTSEAQKRASAKYDKANAKGIYLKLNRTTDADIIEYLEHEKNVQGLIKDLIRAKIAKETA